MPQGICRNGRPKGAKPKGLLDDVDDDKCDDDDDGDDKKTISDTDTSYSLQIFEHTTLHFTISNLIHYMQ